MSTDREIFDHIVRTLNGASSQTVGNVAVNLLVNVLYQAKLTRKDAEEALDSICRRAKEELLSQYDAVTGKRRTVVMPRELTIQMPFHVEQDRI